MEDIKVEWINVEKYLDFDRTDERMIYFILREARGLEFFSQFGSLYSNFLAKNSGLFLAYRQFYPIL